MKVYSYKKLTPLAEIYCAAHTIVNRYHLADIVITNFKGHNTTDDKIWYYAKRDEFYRMNPTEHYKQHLLFNTSRESLPLSIQLTSERRSVITMKDYQPSIRHSGQDKLYFAEHYFLTKYSKPNDVVVYVGSAPGLHIPRLMNEFPDLTWHLYDPAPHKITTGVIHTCFATTENMVKCDLFISDIRTLHKGDCRDDKLIENDMLLQKELFDISAARVGMLKFRLPTYNMSYIEPTELFMAPHGHALGYETRAIVHKNYGICLHDSLAYRERCTYHNLTVRTSIFSDKGCGCYDCSLI